MPKGVRDDEFNVRLYPSEWQCWSNARKRCHGEWHPQYASYGGRGIKVHEEWRNSFRNFMLYVGAKPHPGVSLDRIDNDKGYEPGNVRWATPREQNNNRRPAWRPIDECRVLGYLAQQEAPICF